MEQIWERMKRLRKEKELGQQAVADCLSVSRQTVSSWENKTYWENNACPSLENLFALSNLYNVSIDYLLCKSNFTNANKEFIGEYTGLTDNSIEVLHNKFIDNTNIDIRDKKTNISTTIHLINKLLEDDAEIIRICMSDCFDVSGKIMFFNDKNGNIKEIDTNDYNKYTSSIIANDSLDFIKETKIQKFIQEFRNYIDKQNEKG